jgi:O-antigen ligase
VIVFEIIEKAPELCRRTGNVPVIILSLILIAVTWAIVLLKSNGLGDALKKLNPLHLLAAGIVVVGSVFGHDFFNVSAGPIPITLDRIMFGALLALAGWSWLLNREDLRPINRLDVAMLGVMAILFYSTITHDYKFENNLPLSRLLFFNFIPFGVYAVVRTAKMSQSDLAMYSIVLASFAVYLALTGIAELKQFHAIVFPRYIVESSNLEFFGRGRGPFLNPVSNGVFQIVGLCCLWVWWPKSNSRVRALIVIASLIIVVGVYATLTRSVWLALIVVAGTAIWVPAPQARKGGLVVAATLATILLFPVLGDKLMSFKRDKNVTASEMTESAQLRPLFLTVAMRMFKDRPLLGCGFGQYRQAKYPYLQDAYTGKPLTKTKAYLQHNVFLAYLTEMGLFGLAALTVMLGVMGRYAWQGWADQKKPLMHRQFGLLLAASLAAYCINGMFHDTSIMPMLNMLVFVFAAIVNNIHSTPSLVPEVAATRSTTTPTHRSSQHGYPVAN